MYTYTYIVFTFTFLLLLLPMLYQYVYLCSAVAKICCEGGGGKDGNYVMGHSRWTSEPGAAAAR